MLIRQYPLAFYKDLVVHVPLSAKFQSLFLQQNEPQLCIICEQDEKREELWQLLALNSRDTLPVLLAEPQFLGTLIQHFRLQDDGHVYVSTGGEMPWHFYLVKRTDDLINCTGG